MLFLRTKVCAVVTKIRILRIVCFPVTPAQMCKPRTISHSSNTYKIIALATVSGGFSLRSAPNRASQRRERPYQRLLLFDGLTAVEFELR